MAEGAKDKERFRAGSFLESSLVAKQSTSFSKAQTVYSQGDRGSSVLYIKSGIVKLSAINEDGKEAVIAILEAGDFVGEACLRDDSCERAARATAMETTQALVIQKKEMLRVLREHQEFRSYFISYLLRRNAKTEADLIDQLRNSSEKRLARALILLTRHDKQGTEKTNCPNIPQETLAELIGTTRGRVNLFMNKFRRQGFIDYSKGRLQVHNSLIMGVLQE
ncbi:MAG: Crp/Fnr family transcriptional regulator [Candidatus Acidiferrum sp.]